MDYSFSRRCAVLRKRGYTLGEIAQLTDRPKTSVYFHIKNIPKSERLKKKIRDIQFEKIRGKGPVKGKSLLGRHWNSFQEWSPGRVNLVAHIMFDGAIRTSGILYHNRSEALLKNFRDKMNEVCFFLPKRYNDRSGVSRVAYHNVELVPFFKNKVRILGREITGLPKEFKRQFLKAFFDDEGSIDFRPALHIRRVRGYQHYKRRLLLIQELLADFKISSYVDSRFFEIIISGKNNLETFKNEIDFSPGIKVNGDRSNSIWKKSPEKRRILAAALNSYRS